ncbi:FAD-binding protein [Campylobacter gastrosuis]|uniref:FAD-binding protein n=1 Tax=Campylobacter gastrosuis TaxID=2974576 RepID=A0ABT7HSF4_9BACT|nr:FAD-binding protein [Campylobacter gastrosuis]MDL0089800.1 FAD-binding protein [Campylobacter gastrosuis]
MNVWAFSDNVSRLGDIVGGAKSFGSVNALVVGDESSAKRAFSYGVNEVFLAKSDDMFENLAPSFAEFLKDKSGLVLMPNTKRTKAMASLLGGLLNVGVSTEVSEILLENDCVVCKKMLYGGIAVGSEKISSKLAIVVVNSGTFEPVLPNSDANKEPKEIEILANKNQIKCLKKLPKNSNSVDLNKAKRIVAIGRGVANESDLALIRELCDVLGAELGCSRPIAETEKWLEQDRYIGISSVMPKPEIYIAFGISGQVQHMVGVKDSGRIIAINKDKNAPIFDYADYGIVGDLYKVIPALINALK